MQQLGASAEAETAAGSRASIAEPVAVEAVERAVERSSEHLLGLQREDGHWCGELEGDTILESEYVLLLHYLGLLDDPAVAAKAARAAEHMRRRQLADGGWAIYPGGPTEVSASVKAYFVLKLLGDPADAPHMVRARRAVLEAGGIEATNSFTKIYLSIFGQYDWERCPAVPPEMILLPRQAYFNIYQMSSWSRAIVVPLSIIWAHKPSCEVPPEASIGELSTGRGDAVPPPPHRGETREERWRALFYSVDTRIKHLERLGAFKPFRRRALRRAERWILERLHGSDGLGAIFPPIVNTLIAFDCLGYPLDHPVVRSQLAELEALELDHLEGGETLRVQPCLSPVWDTALAMNALQAAGLPDEHPALEAGGEWLLGREVTKPGDWRLVNGDGEPGGWYFEYANEHYPDCDDTAEVLTVLGRLRSASAELAGRAAAAYGRGLAWLLSMQNPDGGWAAFDRGCTKEILTLIPFADHNAMIDPSCEDITGRVLEALAEAGYDHRHPVVARAVRYLLSKQEEDGTWYGRWGANYIYGTWLALSGLAAVGHDMTSEPCRRAVDWLLGCQNEDGGWGESLASYDDPALKGIGESTAAQTAWALLGLMAAGEAGSEAVARGVGFLLRRQDAAGTWCDEHWTGTGFPQVFYLRYDYYDDYFPLLALAAWRRHRSGRGREADDRVA